MNLKDNLICETANQEKMDQPFNNHKRDMQLCMWGWLPGVLKALSAKRETEYHTYNTTFLKRTSRVRG